MHKDAALLTLVAMWLLFLFGVFYFEDKRLHQQAIDMQESRPYAVIQKDNGQ